MAGLLAEALLVAAVTQAMLLQREAMLARAWQAVTAAQAAQVELAAQEESDVLQVLLT
jgi:hypothetical protein